MPFVILSLRPAFTEPIERLLRTTAGCLLVAALGCGGSTPGRSAPPSPPPQATPEPIFVDGAAEAGLDFVYANAATTDYHLFEIMGGGLALFDYDRDGDLDVYLVQGAFLEGYAGVDEALFPPSEPEGLRDRLYRNDLERGSDGRVRLRFTDVTEQSGIDARGYGNGVAAGDFDNDGWVDLYVNNLDDNQFWRNDGDGTFSDVTRSTGTAESRWSVSSAFFDMDADGWLDLYVGNYVALTVASSRACFDKVKDYCSPKAFDAITDRLFRNRGDGTFEDVTGSSQIGRSRGRALGVVTADFDADGRLDVFVTNDGMENFLWVNQGSGRFHENALIAGCALNETGTPEASMGVTAEDFDEDGDEDLFMTHLRGETHTLYVNDGTGIFADETVRTGLAVPSQPATGFGTRWFDYDNDGRLDLIAVNGAVLALPALIDAGDPYPYHEPNQLFHNVGTGRFEDVSARAGEVFALSEIGRGAAFGDVDNDGDTDVVFVNANAPTRLLLNQVGNRKHWIGLSMVGARVDRIEPGTWVGVHREGHRTQWRRVRTEGSFASASDPRLLVGLGDDARPVSVEAHWLSGRKERWVNQAVDRYVELREGTGEPAE